MSSNSRGKDPKPRTIMKLCAITGGRCQICNKFLFTEQFTYKDNNDSNVAHIVASSPDGPRGDTELSHTLSNDINNLMLLCREHHHLIDDENNLDVFTVAFLHNLKQSRERLFAEYGDRFDLPETNVVAMHAWIKNKDKVNYSLQQMVASFLLQMKPADLYGIEINPSCNFDYNSAEYWQYMKRQLSVLYSEKISRKLELNPQAHFSVFPLAPIPLIMQFGYLMGDKVCNTIHQHFRSPDTWAWISSEQTNNFQVTSENIAKGNKVAIVVEITSPIETQRVMDVYDANVVYRISAEHLGVDAVKSNSDLNAFCLSYLSVCDTIKNSYRDLKEVAVFPAVPVSIAFEMGRRYMKGVYPNFTIFDENNGFIKTLILGE